MVVHSLRRLLEQDLAEKRISLTAILDAEVPPVRIAADQLKQVFLNMVRNAEHAMPQGGEIVIRTAQKGPCVELSITDTGSGILAEHRDHIFDPFFTTKQRGKGVGLGLSVSYGIITAASGCIEVESDVGKGSTFRVILPATQEPARGALDA
jgi:signal transduction histidine kinase